MYAAQFSVDDLLSGAKDTHDLIKNISNIFSEASTSNSKKELTCDIYQDNAAYYVYVDVPGCSKEDVILNIIDDNKLSITVSKTKINCDVILRERSIGTQKRIIDLPDKVTTISAKCNNGLLIVTLQKLTTSSSSRSIPIL